MFIELIVSTYLFGFMNLIRPTDHSPECVGLCKMWLIVIVLVYLAWKSVHERRWAWVWGSLCAMKLKPFLKIIKWCWTFLVIIFNDLDCEYVNVLRYLGNTVQSHSCVSIISFFLRVHGCAYSLLWKASDEWKKHKYNRVPRREKMQRKGTERWEKMHEQTKA